MKVVGYTEDGVKHFTITHAGESYDCRRRGQMFECFGTIATLKKHKQNIEAGLYTSWVADAEPDVSDSAESDVPTGTWDCIDPCAALAALLLENSPPPAEARAMFMLTLDNYGWLAEDGSIDVDRVEREFKRMGLSDES